MITSLTLQMCLYFSGFYLILFGISITGLQFYKWSILPYSTSTLASEFVLLMLLIVVESIRIQLGKRGNLTNKTAPLIASIFLLAPSFLAVLYSLIWQSYVLRVEVVLCGIQIGIQAITLIIFIVKLISILTQPMAI